MPINDLNLLTENILPVRTPQNIGSSIPTPYVEGLKGDYESDKNVYPDYLPPPSKEGLPITNTSEELYNARKFGIFDPTKSENEFAYGQSFGSKMVSGVGKGLLLTGTTFLQTTIGAVNGLVQWGKTGKASSFYNNDLNKWVDDINKEAENKLPNLYTNTEKNANWYTPKYFFTGNFLWDGIVKNLGFSAGAALSGMAFSSILRAIPLTSKLFSIGKAAETLEAIEEKISTVGNATETYGKVKSLSDKFLGDFKILNPGGRAVVAGLSTSGEASFESYQNLNQYRDQKIQEYKDLHEGQEPIGIDLDTINQDAEDVGNYSYRLNVALLSVTNYIQFPKILGSSYTAEKGMINSLTRETGDIIKEGEKYIAKPVGNKVLSTINRVRPYLFSSSEAFEEGSQYVIQTGTQDYYDKKYKNEDVDFMSSLMEGVSETLGTNEGMKNVLIGGLSGALMMGRGRWKQNTREEQNTQTALSSSTGTNAGLNTARLSDFTKETMDAVNRGTVLQEEREELLKQGDISGSKEVEADYIINYLAPRIKYGRFDLVKSEISDYRSLASTDEGFAQLQADGKALEGDTKEAYLERLNSLEETANNVKSLYQSLHLRYGSQMDDKGKPIYSSDIMDKMVYAASKITDYDKRIPSLILKLVTSTPNINQILSEVSLGNDENYNSVLATLELSQEINKDDLVQSFKDVAKLTLRRNQFLKEYNDIKTNPKKHQEIIPEEKSIVDESGNVISKPTVTIKTKNINDEFEIGTPYYLGRVVEYDKVGHEVYREPIITILGENEDGTIQIKAANGRVRNISKEELADYKLGKVSDTLNNKKAKFFMEHQNTIYEFNFGKDKKRKGRLEYSPMKDVLIFKYKDVKGKIREMEVNSKHFIPKKGYTDPILKAVGELSATQQTSLKEFEDQENKVTPEAAKIYEINKKEGRRQIVNDLFEELNDRFKKTTKLIEQRKTDVNLISQDITSLEKKIEEAKIPGRETKKGFKFRPTVRKFIEAINRLSRAKDEIEKEIELLETENNETETVLSYLEDASQNIEELPIDTKELLYELGYEVELLKDTVNETTKQIGGLSRILSNIENALDTAMDFLHSLITDFTRLYPKVPTLIGQQWIDFLKVNPNFTKLKPTYKEDLRELENIVAEVEDFDISPNEEKIKILKSELETLKESLKESTNELIAKQILLDKFQKAYDTYKEQKVEEKLLENNAKLIKEVLGTTDRENTPTTKPKEFYEAVRKKAVDFIWRSTMGVNRGKEHQMRANKFGANLETFENRKNIRGIYITSQNEDQIGLSGLMDHLRTTNNVIDESIDKDGIIAMVMVVLTENGPVLVDENGQPLTKDNDMINSAIYQVFPLAELKWGKEYGEGSMFREGTPQEVIDSVTEQYTKIREDIIENNDNLSNIHEIGASFGIPIYAQQIGEDGNPIIKNNGKPLLDYSIRNSVEDVGLVEEDDFYVKELILIPKVTDVAEEGTTKYEDAKGRPFLQLPNAVLPLQNRKHTSTEAETIFQAIKLYAKNMMDPKIGLHNEKTDRLYNWLTSIVYWGIPENQEGERKSETYNSIFWEKTEDGKFMLKISGLGKEYLFNPVSLEENKGQIITLLEAMHNNINSSMSQKLYDSYEEIISISDQGIITARTWINYQSYLLANKFMTADDSDIKNKEARKDLPLSTIMQTLKATDGVNRTGIYFYTEDNKGDVDIPTVVKPTIIRPGKLSKTPTEIIKQGEYKLDGETHNIFISPKGKKIVFIAKPDGSVLILKEGDINEILIGTRENIHKTKPELTSEQVDVLAKETIKGIISKQITHLVKEEISEESFTIEEENEEKVNNIIEVKKENSLTSETDYFGQLIKQIVGKTQHAFQRLNLDELTSEVFKNHFGEEKGLIVPERTKLVNEIKDVSEKFEVFYKRQKSFLSKHPKFKRLVQLSEEYNSLSNISLNYIAALKNALSNKTSTQEVNNKFYDTWKRYYEINEEKAIILKEIVKDLFGVTLLLEYATTSSKYVDGFVPTTLDLLNEYNLKTKEEEEFEITNDEQDEKTEAKRAAFFNKKKPGTKSDLRILVKENTKDFKEENWPKLEKWLKANFPNIPIYRVKNIIQATNGRQAWGMLQDGAIYIYENAEIGTAYHEVFEAVWKMFSTPKEQQSIIAEFKSRTGSFTDRPTGETYEYTSKEVTPQMIKEQLAEEFRDYIQNKKIPSKPNQGKPFILKLFSDLVTFIKEFFTGKNALTNTEKLFKNINEGQYKDRIPFENQLAFANKEIIDIEDAFATEDSEFSLVGITDKERSEMIQHMTYLTLRSMTDTDQNLFNVMNRKKSDVYDDLKKKMLAQLYEKIITLEDLLENGDLSSIEKKEVKILIKQRELLINTTIKQWESIVKRHEEFLKGYQIEFDENDELQYRDEDKVRESDYVEANKIDSFKKANSAIKLLLATVPIVDENGDWIESSIGGVKLIPMSQTFISLMNNLHTSRSLEEMVSRLRNMAENDSNYRGLYKRITKKSWTDKIFKDGNKYGGNFDNIETEHGLRLLSSIWKTFKKQNPEVKNVFILESGEIVVGNANLSTAAVQLRDDYVNDIISTAKSGKGYFIYDEKKKAYIGDKNKIKSATVESLPAMVSFLSKLGVVFDLKQVKNLRGDLNKFKEAVQAIKISIDEGKDIVTFSGKVLNISGRLLELGEIQAKINDPEFDSTFFNINNERTQSFIGTNPASDLHDFLSQIEKFDLANVAGTNYAYLKTDVFTKGSVILKRMFSPKGVRSANSDVEGLMQTVYISGTDNQIKGKQRQSSKLSYKERLVQELNLNIAGYYMNLVPGDASMEWAVKMGNEISKKVFSSGMNTVNLVFKNYFLSELELVRENRPIAKGRNTNEMRFFKSILGKELHDEIINDKHSIEEVYTNHEGKINSALNNFIKDQTDKLYKNLHQYGIVKEDEFGFQFENVNIKENLTSDELNTELKLLTINYVINNIELHKLLYSDPYQYADELKRIKNFNSPRQAIVYDSPKMSMAYDRVWNKEFKKGDIGWTNFTQEFFRSITYQDVMGYIKDLPGYEDLYKETDGGGVISFPAYRHFRIRNSDWNDKEELQYKYDIAFEKQDKGKELSDEEIVLINNGNPSIRSAYTPIKPIVSGNKANDKTYNDILLDKFALYPISYRLLTHLDKAGSKTASNAIALYNKMQEEKIDYSVFESSRKVGAVTSVPVYNAKGEFNTTPYAKESIINVPFSIISVQTDVPSKDDGSVTRGSQITKLVTMDFMEAGVPIDFELEGIIGKARFSDRYKAWYSLTEEQRLEKSPLYKEIKNNQYLLEAMIENGYQNLLKQLGITETILKNGKHKYSIENLENAGVILRNEILKREVNDNISDALQSFIDGKSVLEATPAYQQVRNILYSIADREVISQKISGGMKVLIPSALLESVRAEETIINGKKGFTSDALEFYKKDGKQVCEIMIGRWFKSDMSDKDLLEYLNTTKEGQKILSGIAFRIPTQKQNSIESFVIKQFLPQEFGDSVVLPAAMVQKTGGDFDIDKLTMYFKNVFKNLEGNISLVEYKGSEKETKDYYDNFFSENIWKKIETLENKDDFRDTLLDVLTKLDEHVQISLISPKTYLTFEEFKFYEKHFDLLYDIIDQAEEQEMRSSQFIQKQIDRTGKQKADLFVKLLNESLRETYINSMYKKSLQNEYIQSSQNLVSHPSNFDRLIKPNSAEQLKKLSEEIALKTIGQSFDYTEVGNMLDRGFMSRLRQAFVSGKQAIGIAAVSQTNHSLNQRQPIYIDVSKLENVSEEDKKWLGNALITFDKYNKIEINGKSAGTLSMIKNADGQDISDIIAQFIDGYVDISKGPWIMEIGATPNVASTWLFLVKLGVPVDTVAYFMNQPIIKDYLRSIETAGYTWLFMDSFVNDMMDIYESGRQVTIEQKVIPSKTVLQSTIGKKTKDLTAEQKEQQQFILLEFLKYAKMANQLFLVSQGSNYDTASFNDPYLVFKKAKQLEKAQQTIISSVDDLMANSFIGKLEKTIGNLRDGIATILKSDQSRVRNIIQQVLLPYIEENDRDFVKIAQKAVNDLFDYAVQTNEGLNKLVTNILVTDGGVGAEIMTLMQEIKKNSLHPLFDNYIIGQKGIMQSQPSRKAEGKSANNIKVKGLGNKTYDQNNIIYAFREIKQFLKGKNSKLYDRIVQLAILQSGLSHSNISFTSVIPQEDFEKIYNKTLSKLESLPNLENFIKLNVFQRNNWNNDDIIPHNKAKLITSKKSGKSYYNLPMSFIYDQKYIKNAIDKNKVPQLLKQRQNDKEANFNHMVYSWERQENLITPEWKTKYPRIYGWKLVKQIKADMRKIGDYSYINKGLFEKVRDNFGNPLETGYKDSDGNWIKQFVYKAINAWGEGPRANEFYDVEHHSVIDNGFIKVDGVDNNVIIDIFMGQKEMRNALTPIEITEQKTDDWQKEDNDCPVPF